MKLQHILAYFCAAGRHPLSVGRLEKMVYLADWYAFEQTGRRLSDIRWKYETDGPSATEIKALVQNHPWFENILGTTRYATRKHNVRLSENASKNTVASLHKYLSEPVKAVLDKVTAESERLIWHDLCLLTVATPPVKQALPCGLIIFQEI